MNGAFIEGQTLSLDPLPIYSGNPTPTVTWRWQSRPNGGGTISVLQTGGDLALTGAHVGHQIRVQDMASNSVGSTGWFTNPWLGPVVSADRVTVADADAIAVSAHSFPYQAIAGGEYGNLGLYRSGDIFINFMEFSSLKQRWDANGLDRTATYDGALLVTEIGDLVTGLANPDSAQGIETLQHLYWYALTAQAKGCTLFGIYPPHNPEGSTVPLGVTMGIVQYWVNWLRARPEITIPVYAIPVPIMVGGMVDLFAPASIYADGLHLRTPTFPSPNQMNNALGQVVRMFLTGERPADDPGWNAELIPLVDAGWSVLQQYEITGFGGAEVIPPVSVASDPLPSPAPLP